MTDNIKYEQIILRCEDGQEAVVFNKYIHYDGDIDYEINVEDSFVGGCYVGFFGKIKRAWRAFKLQPVVYTGVYCEDKLRMKKFLTDCLELLEK